MEKKKEIMGMDMELIHKQMVRFSEVVNSAIFNQICKKNKSNL